MLLLHSMGFGTNLLFTNSIDVIYFEFFKEYNLTFLANNNKLEGYVDGKLMIEVEDNDNYFEDGMIGLMVENGSVRTDEIKVE